MSIQQPYQFAFHDRVSSTAPQFAMFDIVAGAFKNKRKLTREEKDTFFHSIQNNTGSGSANYKLGGWIYPFGQFMNTYLVNSEGYGWREIKAFDKTCIRKSWYTNSGILEILTKPTK